MRFEKWLSLREANQPGINPPEQNQGDDTMDVPALIEKRLTMLLSEIETKRNMPKAQQVEILAQIIQQMSSQFGLGKQQVQAATKQGMSPQPQGQPPQMPPGPPGATPVQGQPLT